MSTTPLQDDIAATLLAGPMTAGELSQCLRTGVASIRRAASALIAAGRARQLEKRNGSHLIHLTTRGQA